jgi:hypothetical protein
MTTIVAMGLSRNLGTYVKTSAASSIGFNDAVCALQHDVILDRLHICVSEHDSNGAVGVAEWWRKTMKTIVSALVALSFHAGVVTPASAAEPFSIKQLDA